MFTDFSENFFDLNLNLQKNLIKNWSKSWNINSTKPGLVWAQPNAQLTCLHTGCRIYWRDAFKCNDCADLHRDTRNIKILIYTIGAETLHRNTRDTNSKKIVFRNLIIYFLTIYILKKCFGISQNYVLLEIIS
jgi:hypothetical protein